MPFQGAVVKGLPLKQHPAAFCHILTIGKSIAVYEKWILYGKYDMNSYTAQHFYTLIQCKHHKGKVNIFKDFWDEMRQLQIYSPTSLSGDLFDCTLPHIFVISIGWIGDKRWFKWLWTWHGGCRSISETADLPRYSHLTISRVSRRLSEGNGQDWFEMTKRQH